MYVRIIPMKKVYYILIFFIIFLETVPKGMVFIATSNNIISGRSVLLLEETRFELTTLMVIGIDYIGIAINLTAMQSRPRLPLGTVQKSKNNC